MLRASAFVAVAPVLGGRVVTPRARITLAVALALLLVAVLPEPPPMTAFTAEWWLTALQQVVVGLSFAQMTDPLRGTSSGVLAAFLNTIAILVFLAMDGHLQLVDALATSFTVFPIGTTLQGAADFMRWLDFSVIIFTGAAQVALPVMTALLATNLALGLVSRAAPSLNLFAISFPASLLLVLIALWAWLPAISAPLGELFALSREAAIPASMLSE